MNGSRIKRLGVYADLVYRREGDVLSTDRAFVHFVAALAPHLDELVLFGRLDPEPGRSPYAIAGERVRLVPLPHYPSLTDVVGVGRAIRGSRAVFARELERLDAVWLFGPHPLAEVFARAADRARTPVFLGVRQDLPQYIANRLPNRRWFWAVGLAHALDTSFRRRARRAPAVVVGEALAERYAGGPARVLATGFSLIRDAQLARLDAALERRWDGELRVLSVGRLDPEKNPLLLPEILSRLRGGDWRLLVAGEGPLADTLNERARELGVDHSIELRGYVPNGPLLWELYGSSHAFLHVSLTEGLPQVLFEAQAAGLPIVATDVGGVAAALDGGRTGLLIPPNDAEAAAAALERLRGDETLRAELIKAGLDNARRETLDAQVERVVAFFEAELAHSRQRMR